MTSSDTTAHFHQIRVKELSKVFQVKNLVELWRSVVKDQMRSFEIGDLHGYLDFTLSVANRSAEIRSSVLSGSYTAHRPLIFRQEKKLGIKRHMTIPSPYDALVFQAIVERLRPRLNAVQPSQSAYYSRDRHTMKLPHSLKASEYDLWWHLWPKFQKEIFKFSKQKKYVVVTDLSNYYDSLDLRSLRNTIVHKMKAPEVLVDLMFSVIDDLGWNPDYLPKRNMGLPVVNLEAFRFLAHVFLFDADRMLMAKTKKCFARWMDDINFGVDTTDEARAILSELSDVLKSRGLSLNLAKTQILSSPQAARYFKFPENARLDKIDASIKANTTTALQRKELTQLFRESVKSPLGNAEKITKRCLRYAGILGVDIPLGVLRKLFVDTASLRSAVATYLALRGYSPKRAELMAEIAGNAIALDDGAKFLTRDVLLGWNVPYTDLGKKRMHSLLEVVKTYPGEVGFCVAIAVLAKYGEAHDILNFINSKRAVWRGRPFVHRQVVSVMPRLWDFRPDIVERYLQDAIDSGVPDAASVAQNFQDLRKINFLSQTLKGTLFPSKKSKGQPYPLPKMLVLLWLRKCGKLATKTETEISAVLRDRWYVQHLLA